MLCLIFCINRDMTSSITVMIILDSAPQKTQKRSYDCLHKILQNLGLTISKKKLVPPSTKANCLGALIDTEQSTISIPPKN